MITKITRFTFIITILALLGGCEDETKTVEAQGRQYVAAVQAKEYEKAYNMLNRSLQEYQSLDNYIDYVKNYTQIKPESMMILNSATMLHDTEAEVSFSTENGNIINIYFLKQDSNWVIHRIDELPLFQFYEEFDPKLSEARAAANEELKKNEKLYKNLAHKTMVDFSKALQTKSFKSFYNTISSLWKKEITAEKIQEAYQHFLDNNINLLPAIQQDAMTWDANPEILEGTQPNGNKLNVLQLAGHYSYNNHTPQFVFHYVKESGKWKLLKMQVKTG